MQFENKIAIVIKDDLLDWQKLNVASFLASSVAIQFPETHGRPFVNASASEYLPFIKQPILIYKADDQAQIDRTFSRAKQRELKIGIYTEPLFATKNEDENHIEISKFTDDNQTLVGIIVYGKKRKVDKALNGMKFHK
ncbi:DUF2000 domain-containing protein [Zunongwangia endophytica]|uniref:DUF2000 family protein n=1 Tax=Zunongwangia endophytica TaxID=1808945 RepID=A0ABV8HET1_9FLAO|nr:DUF2000 domain-containing protein [Zunongwangia endophytica]MDN3596860.1 DUF2000 domain-containing protein [Zunongwangia endophytica]